jgi:predicted RNA-binding Zn-ribbon protein involved in translation (DUF1610 family)
MYRALVAVDVCPECGSSDIYGRDVDTLELRTNFNRTLITDVLFRECAVCGLEIEEYIARSSKNFEPKPTQRLIP